MTAREALNADDLIAIVNSQIAEGCWNFSMLYDLRTPVGATSASDTDVVAAYVNQQVQQHGTRGPVALVANGLGPMADVAKSYGYKAKGFTIKMFWDLDDAERWLSAQ